MSNSLAKNRGRVKKQQNVYKGYKIWHIQRDENNFKAAGAERGKRRMI